ncbi:uncharacterized protein LOC134194556 [Corticium candelabrum]|uniref:uncharacterized protein LOC134194556 n=1 Tax=Corticium candelabrum TaxID=121492 RepID=UPI002E268963|nr:uncharacterized protein LOC134194556 [Corticium candelabrum]
MSKALVEKAMLNIEYYNYSFRYRVLHFLNELLQIASFICPTATSTEMRGSISTHPYLTASLSRRLQTLNLPSYSSNCVRANETSDHLIESNRIKGLVACQLLANVLLISCESEDPIEHSDFLLLRSRALRGLSQVGATIGAVTVIEVIEDVFRNIDNTSDLPYRLLFRLAEDFRGRPSEALEIGVRAYTAMWSYFHCGNETKVVRSTPSFFALLLRGAHCMGSSAMQLDLDATPSGDVTVSFENTDHVLRLVMEKWEDALVIFHVVAELARVYEGRQCCVCTQSEDVGSIECTSTLQPRSSLISLSRANGILSSVLNRCKAVILATLADTDHRSWRDCQRSDQRIVHRPLTDNDFLCLKTIIQALPDDSVDVKSLASHSAFGNRFRRDVDPNFEDVCPFESDFPVLTNCYESYYGQLIRSKLLRHYLFPKP